MFYKLCNIRIKEFFRGKFEKDLVILGKVVEVDQFFRDNFKIFSIVKKRQIEVLVRVYICYIFFISFFFV